MLVKEAAKAPKSQNSKAQPSDSELELHADAWGRFERAVDKVAKAKPMHRQSKAKQRAVTDR
jgi:hypothetical protein